MGEGKLEELAKVMFNAAYSAWVLNLKTHNPEVFGDLRYPKVGDYVIETTNPHVPRLVAIGKLVSEERQDGGHTLYTIEKLNGEQHQWENANFIKVADDETLSHISC